MQPILIRRAHPDESGVLTRLVLRSKQHWGYPEEMMALWVNELTITPEFIDRNPVHVAEMEGDIQGVFALVFDGTAAELEHLWVEPGRMGCGVGRAMFSRAVELARHSGAESLTIVSDPHAEDFYTHLGARRIGEVDSVPEGRKLPKLIVNLQPQ